MVGITASLYTATVQFEDPLQALRADLAARVDDHVEVAVA